MAGYRVAVCDDFASDPNNNQTTNLLNNKTTKIMTQKNFNFKGLNTANRYMFNQELQALVEVKPLLEVYDLNNGKCYQEWRVANTDKVMKTCYCPATEEEPEKFDGKVYKTFKDFEDDNALKVGDCDLFPFHYDERDLCRGLVPNHRNCVCADAEGAYVWVFQNGEAVKWYFRKHIDKVFFQYTEKGQIEVTSDYNGEIPEPYSSSEDVHNFNDYRFIDENGDEQVREGVLRRLLLEPDQKELAGKLQAVLDECKAAGMCIYWSNADYTLNAVNTRKVQRIEYDPCVDEETEEAIYFDDSRASTVFKNVTDYNSEDGCCKFVIKKQ